jgi:hypothetical protein
MIIQEVGTRGEARSPSAARSTIASPALLVESAMADNKVHILYISVTLHPVCTVYALPLCYRVDCDMS